MADPPVNLFQVVYYMGEGRDGTWHASALCQKAQKGRLRQSKLGAMLASGRQPCPCTEELLRPLGPHYVQYTPTETTNGANPTYAEPPYHHTINPRPDGHRERRHTTLGDPP